MREFEINVLVEKRDGSTYSELEIKRDPDNRDTLTDVMRLWVLACERAAMFEGHASMTITYGPRSLIIVTAAAIGVIEAKRFARLLGDLREGL